MNGKALVRSIRAFRMVTAALLCDFLKYGTKTFEDIRQCFDTVNVSMCYDYVHLDNLSDISAYRIHNVLQCKLETP